MEFAEWGTMGKAYFPLVGGSVPLSYLDADNRMIPVGFSDEDKADDWMKHNLPNETYILAEYTEDEILAQWGHHVVAVKNCDIDDPLLDSKFIELEALLWTKAVPR